MATLTIEKTYADGVTPTAADLDNICDSIETFLNVTKLSSDNIKDNSLDASAVFQTGSIPEGKIANDSVTTAKIADNAVTSVKIADDAVTAVKIQDGAITTAKIADGALTSAKLANNAITKAKKPTAGYNGNTQLVSSATTEVFSSTYTVSATRQVVICNSDGFYCASSPFTSATPTTDVGGDTKLYKDGSAVTHGNILYSGYRSSPGNTLSITIPMSSTIYIDAVETSSNTSRVYKNSVDTYVNFELLYMSGVFGSATMLAKEVV